MNLYAYAMGTMDEVWDYIEKHYGEVPRFRGALFMKTQEPSEDADSPQDTLFNSFCGKDVIFIHTRCGDCEMGYDDADSNYVAYGCAEWEESLGDLFIDHITDEYDSTYCDHYVAAVPGKDYDALLAFFQET